MTKERDSKLNLSTKILHFDRMNYNIQNGATMMPIVPSIAYEFKDINDIQAVFQGRSSGFNYARQNSPTVSALEEKITMLESGVGSVIFSTGMAAYDAVLATLLQSGDHVIASNLMFANTISLLKSYKRRFNVEIDFVDPTNIDLVTNSIKSSTKILLVETVANPLTQVPPLDVLGELCKQYGIAFIVDNTLTTPFGFSAKNCNASLIIHSLSKALSGHGQTLGGSVTDTGLFNWVGSEKDFIETTYEKFAEKSYLTQLRKRGLRDKGATMSAYVANQIAMMLETAELRIEKSAKNAARIAQYLDSHKYVESVFHPSLSNHGNYTDASRLFKYCGQVLSFELKSYEKVVQFFSKLNIIIQSTNLGDNRTLAIHPSTTIFFELSEEEKKRVGITDSLIRMSVGIEDEQDLINQLEYALA